MKMVNSKLVNLILIGVLIGTFSFIVYHNIQDSSEVLEEKILYQGPVPEGYDEQYFRETGITKPLGDKE